MTAAQVPGLAAARVTADGRVELMAFGVRDQRSGEPVTTATLFAAPQLAEPLAAYVALRLDRALLAQLDRARLAGSPPAFLRPPAGLAPLARALEAATGRRFDEVVGAEVLGPLAMLRSGPGPAPADGEAAVGHDLLGEALRSGVNASSPPFATTAADVARLLAELLAPRRLDRATLDLMLAPRTTLADNVAWGLGLGLEQSAGAWGFWLAGQGDGFTFLVAGSRALGRAAALLTNSDNGLAVAEPVLTELIGGDHPALPWLQLERCDDPAFQLRRRLVGSALEGGPGELATLLGDLELAYGPLVLTEPLLNRVGYDLLGRGQVAAAVVALRRNAELFRDSWNVHDSLGEALAAAGDAAAAIASYERSLALNPGNANAVLMLERLRARPQ
jgi:CubicO group peptidase (beta-lactamase class C family)